MFAILYLLLIVFLIILIFSKNRSWKNLEIDKRYTYLDLLAFGTFYLCLALSDIINLPEIGGFLVIFSMVILALDIQFREKIIQSNNPLGKEIHLQVRRLLWFCLVLYSIYFIASSYNQFGTPDGPLYILLFLFLIGGILIGGIKLFFYPTSIISDNQSTKITDMSKK
jgi:hypothetical protein